MAGGSFFGEYNCISAKIGGGFAELLQHVYVASDEFCSAENTANFERRHRQAVEFGFAVGVQKIMLLRLT